MYFNDVHIIYYVAIAILGLITGILVNWTNYRQAEQKKVLSLDYFRTKRQYKENYLVILSNIIIYILILNKYGIQDTFFANLELIKYLILVPMLLSVFVIDYKKHKIPNRLTLTMFETGLVISFLYSLSNIAITINMLLGMLAGIGIFALIILLSRLILGKDYMLGLGDVKLIGALGLYFGVTNIVIISLISFFLAAIISIILLILKLKKVDSLISFGPIIVMASLISILLPVETLLNILFTICTLGLYKK